MTFLNKTELNNLAYRELCPADHYMAMEELKDGGTVCINKNDDKTWISCDPVDDTVTRLHGLGADVFVSEQLK
jgi:hypothetical protein